MDHLKLIKKKPLIDTVLRFFKRKKKKYFSELIVIPCNYSEENGEIYFKNEIYENIQIVPEDLYNLHYSSFRYKNKFKIDSFINSKKRSDEIEFLTNNEKIDKLVSSASNEYNYDDIIVAYFDELKNHYVQLAYLKKFAKKRTFNIIEYFYNEVALIVFENEEYLDKRILSHSHKSKLTKEFGIEPMEILHLKVLLKRMCIEASFNTLYSDDIEDINNSIYSLLKNKNYDIDQTFEIIFYFKKIGILEFHFKNIDNYEKEKYIPNFSSDKKTYFMVVGFSSSFLKIINKKEL